jgi:hypothetical protein
MSSEAGLRMAHAGHLGPDGSENGSTQSATAGVRIPKALANLQLLGFLSKELANG